MRRVRQFIAQKSKNVPLVLGCGIISMGVLGCETQSFLDPSEVSGRQSKRTIVQQINEGLPVGALKGVDQAVEEDGTYFADSVEPGPQDMQPAPAIDYLFGPGDLVMVTIPDLYTTGLAENIQRRITNTGNISMPQVGEIKAAGLTEAQLAKAIGQAYIDAQILTRPIVSVVGLEERARKVTITGAVQRPGPYQLIDPDARLTDILALAGGEVSPYVSTIYVIRTNKAATGTATPAPAPGQPGQPAPAPADDLAPPQSRATFGGNSAYLNAAPEGDPLAPAGEQPAAQPPVDRQDPIAEPPGQVGKPGDPIVNVEGVDVPATRKGEDQIAQPPATAPADGSFQFNSIASSDRRIIRIPYDELRGKGKLKYNIPIHPGDTVIVENPLFGTYYMGGHVLRPGAYVFNGQPTTMTNAVIAASGFDQLAIPARTDLVRTIGRDKKVLVRVDLAKVFNGTAPDLYLRPGDELRVGTNALAPFLAAVRGAFRLTYGFGFIYDRNYAYDDDDRFR